LAAPPDAHHHRCRSPSSCTAPRRTARWSCTLPSHFFRFWLWLTTGIVTKEWVAIHRKHHAKCETAEDPHSPQTRTASSKVLLRGSELYRAEAKNAETLKPSTAMARPTTGSSAMSTPPAQLGLGVLMLVIDLVAVRRLGI
jgi:stearoyl-CoA desaturase (delta-9 desaturase)